MSVRPLDADRPEPPPASALPLRIVTHQVSLDGRAEALIREEATRLERFDIGLIGCQVVVEGPGKRDGEAMPFRVRIDLTAPGDTFIVSRQQGAELTAAIHDGFSAARRELEERFRTGARGEP